MSDSKQSRPLLVRFYNFLSGYTLAVILLSLLLALTYFGTMAQVEVGLYDASEKYFQSLFLIDKIGPVPIVLPGVYLVSALLFLNLLLGAIIRARKSWKRPGMLIAHGGILYILLAGFVAFHFTEEGSMLLYEGDRADEIYNLTDWSIEVARHDAEGKRESAYVIGEEDLKPLWKKGARRTFFAEGMPFEFEIYSYARNISNSKGQLTGLPLEKDRTAFTVFEGGEVIDGLAIVPQETSITREANTPATYIKVKDSTGKVHVHSILVGANPFAPRPLTVEVAASGAVVQVPSTNITETDSGGETWSIDLTRSRYTLPFGVELEKFEKEDHPGTARAREYSSDVYRVDNGEATEKYHISMNKPMRYAGYTLYQASWGPPGAKPSDRLYTSLAVSRNPADQWPKYGTYVISLGMVIHFMQKLFAYLRRSARSREKKEVKP
ncbi:MAG: cytochrome c biogenesis protein ResB [Verrucomicrobiaceae bacterium]|nr:cytochrome c biogenesis protein ResB [Verrucomicrobiaceae bacterium]